MADNDEIFSSSKLNQSKTRMRGVASLNVGNPKNHFLIIGRLELILIM